MEEHKLNWHFPTAIETVTKRNDIYFGYRDTGILQFLERFGIDHDDPIVVDAMKRYDCELDYCGVIVSPSSWNLSRALNEILYFVSKKFMDEKLHKFICYLCDFTGAIPQRYFAEAWNFVERHYPELFKSIPTFLQVEAKGE